MRKLTREQREALKAVYDRRPMYVGFYVNHPKELLYPCIGTGAEQAVRATCRRASYREFRRTVQYGSGCIMVPWCGMWLGIEPDGYTHS